LIKGLSGAIRPDGGEIWLDGKKVEIASPMDGQRRGIAVIYQELNLVPPLSVRENIFLGRERTRLGVIGASEERAAARELFKRLEVEIDPDVPCRLLRVAQQQIVEIAKALSQQARIIVMDEPTAALTRHETESLFRIIGELRTRGIGIVYVSHRLEEVFRICDRVTVMRDGRHVATQAAKELDRKRLIELMVGRKLEAEFPVREATIGEACLEVANMSRGAAVRDVSLSLRRGEVLGITGLIGAGRTELARLIFGADRADSGVVRLNGRELKLRSPREAIAHGICLLTEDRKAQGLVLDHSLRENFGLPNLNRLSRLGLVRQSAERSRFAHFAQSLRLKFSHAEQSAKNLSGGNQQKLVLAKWLERDAQVIIFDEPTRGVDVGAKFEIYQLINELAKQGKGILLISSDLPEVLGMSDRILVMRQGRLAGALGRGATQEQVMSLAAL
jgi:ABC-type sugar transport system ATPase subunit